MYIVSGGGRAEVTDSRHDNALYVPAIDYFRSQSPANRLTDSCPILVFSAKM